MSDARGRVSDHAPDGRGLVAPERAVGTGRTTTLRRDDKHRRANDQTSATSTWVARPRWLVPAAVGALLAVVLVAAAVVALGGGDNRSTVVAHGTAPTVATRGVAPGATVAPAAGAAITAAGGEPATTTQAATTTTGLDPTAMFAGTWDVTVSNVRLALTMGAATGVGLDVGPDNAFSLVIPPGTQLADGSTWIAARGGTMPNGTYTIPCAATCTGTFQSSILRDPTGYRYGRDNAGHPMGSAVECDLFADDSIGRVTIDAPTGASPGRVDAFHYTGASSVSVGTPCQGAAMVLYDLTATRVT
jgi:hypothetical protein